MNYYNIILNNNSISLDNIIERDFKKETIFIPNDNHLKIIKTIYSNFISYETFYNIYIDSKDSSIILLDTCAILLNEIDDFNNFSKDKIYVITCGVFLEILQGINNYTINNNIFIKDLYKLIYIKEILENNCVFLIIGRKFRSYWEGYKPSISCKNSNNNNKPHYKLLRDIDTELCRLSNLFNCCIYTKDKFLQKRNNKIIKKNNQKYNQI